MTPGGEPMRPEILLLEPMMAPIEASLDENYRVHRLFEVQDRAAYLADTAPRIRAIVTGGATGASNDLVDGLPALEIIAINGVGTDAVDLNRARARKIRVIRTQAEAVGRDSRRLGRRID